MLLFKDKWGNIHQIAQRNNFHTIVFNFSRGVPTAVSNNVILLIPQCHLMIDTF